MTAPRKLLCLFALASASAFVPHHATAQDTGPGTGGAVTLARHARMAGTTRRVLMVGAHPDDEDTDLIAVLTRGHGVETAYLSLTRGEGGQNLIGRELGAALGLLRTEELLAARTVDGGQQYFTRAFDFGFSKTAEETFRFWPREQLLEDVVRVIRRFRPQVIVSVWSGTERDGHGHHQVSGIVAREAFDAANDPTRFPHLNAEGLRPHQVAKFYRGAWGTATSTLTLAAGRIEAASGFSFHQLAAQSRSRHRSQDMGSLEQPGPWPVRLNLEALAPGTVAAPSDSLFAGVVSDVARPQDIDLRAHASRLAMASVIVDAYAADDEVATGESVVLTLLTWNAGTDTVRAVMQPDMTPGWRFDGGTCDSTYVVEPGSVKSCTATGTNTGSLPDQPYFLVDPVDGGMYRWKEPSATWGRPFDRAPTATFVIHLSRDQETVAHTEIRGRFLDQARGEVRRPLVRVPRVALSLQPARLLWRSGLRSRTFEVQAEHLAQDSTSATVRVQVAPGWQVSPPQQVRFTGEGQRARMSFTVTAPAGVAPGEVDLAAEAIIGADTLRVGINRIVYPHIPKRVFFTSADAQAVVAPVVFPARSRIAYVRGAADMIPEALANAGVVLRVLSEADLLGDGFTDIDVLVIGPRAYEVSDGLRRAHPRVMQWVEAGGTLIVQYQQYQYVQGGFPPRPFTLARPHDRVTDQHADVTLLAPGHPLMRFPNVITDRDFDNWRQERGLYFASTWDIAWTPLLEMHDANEPAKRGALLVASVGRGRAVYTGIAFFRQLPAAVPGAWRLFANLLALGEGPRDR